MGDSQDISKVQNSDIYQAGRDLTINFGLTVEDVKSIVKKVVGEELDKYSKTAEKTAEERLNRFSEDLVKDLTVKLSDKLDRFNEPALQFAVRESALSYVKSGKDEDEKALIDLMIERVKVDEHTTRQKLIDQAIKIVPSLSPECLSLLSLIVFRALTFTGSRENFEHWFDSVSPVLSMVQNVSPLDIDYLLQADCVSAVSGIMTQNGWIDTCLKANDLFFRHSVPIFEVSKFKEKYGITSFEGGFSITKNPFKGTEALVVLVARLLEFCPDGTARFNLTSTNLIEQCIQAYGLPSIGEDILELVNASTMFSPQEVKEYFIGRNSNWEKAIELLDGQRLRSFTLKPVGVYIGLRQLSILSGQEIPLETFYK